MEIGAQFFTLRDFCKTTEDLAETLKKVRDIGYKTVQISGTCAYDPAWLKSELDKNELHCVLTHTSGDRMRYDTESVIEDHNILDCKYIGLGYFPMSAVKEDDSPAHFFELYTPVAKAFAQRGKYFMYHNHDMEMQKKDGKPLLQILAEGFAPELVGFTLDTFWIQAGGGDPAQWIEKLSCRVPCIHLKDFAYGRKMEVIGEGNINFDRVFAKAEVAGTKYMLVEQDDCNGHDPFDCLRRSYEYLKACGFN